MVICNQYRIFNYATNEEFGYVFAKNMDDLLSNKILIGGSHIMVIKIAGWKIKSTIKTAEDFLIK